MRALLGPGTEDSAVWGPPIIGDESGFRSRAKMAVSGTANDPVLGLPGQGTGVDLGRVAKGGRATIAWPFQAQQDSWEGSVVKDWQASLMPSAMVR